MPRFEAGLSWLDDIIANDLERNKVDPSKLAYQRLLPNYKTMRDIMNENLKTNSDKSQYGAIFS